MISEEMNDEFDQMYEDPKREFKMLNNDVFRQPIRRLSHRSPITLEEGKSVKEAVEMMRKNRFGSLLITQKGILSGIFTERDVMYQVALKKKEWDKIKIETVMSADPECFRPDDSIEFIINAMHVGAKRHIAIVDEQKHPIGVISVKDIIEFIVGYFPQELLNLPPQPLRKTENREGA